jgi:hypothetical protein
LKATGIFSFQILETLQDYQNLFVFFNTENLQGSLKWLGEPEALVFTKNEICPTQLEIVRRGRPEWDDALRYEEEEEEEEEEDNLYGLYQKHLVETFCVAWTGAMFLVKLFSHKACTDTKLSLLKAHEVIFFATLKR